MCVICKDDRCSSVCFTNTPWAVMATELYHNPRRKFILFGSPSSCNAVKRFCELHVLDNVSAEEAGTCEDHRGNDLLSLTAKEVQKNINTGD